MPAIFFLIPEKKVKKKKNYKQMNSREKLENFSDKERVILGFYLWSSNGQISTGGLTGTFRTSFMDINQNLSFPSQRQFYNWPISYSFWEGFVRKLKKRKNKLTLDVFSPAQSLYTEWKKQTIIIFVKHFRMRNFGCCIWLIHAIKYLIF